MGKYKCCVPWCGSSTEKDRGTLSFYKFPANETLRDQWLKAIGRKNFKPTENHRVCSRHFSNGRKSYMNRVPTLFWDRRGKCNIKSNPEPEEIVPEKTTNSSMGVSKPQQFLQEVHNFQSQAGTLYTGVGTMRDERKLLDVSVVAEEKSFPAHKLVLAAFSPYLRSVFSNQKNISSIVLNAPANIVKTLVDYIYTGDIMINKENIFTLKKAADMMQVEQLQTLCSEFIRKFELTLPSSESTTSDSMVFVFTTTEQIKPNHIISGSSNVKHESSLNVDESKSSIIVKQEKLGSSTSVPLETDKVEDVQKEILQVPKVENSKESSYIHNNTVDKPTDENKTPYYCSNCKLTCYDITLLEAHINGTHTNAVIIKGVESADTNERQDGEQTQNGSLSDEDSSDTINKMDTSCGTTRNSELGKATRYSCKDCGFSCYFKSLLLKHMETHINSENKETTENEFEECPYCDYTCLDGVDSLDVHLKTVHKSLLRKSKLPLQRKKSLPNQESRKIEPVVVAPPPEIPQEDGLSMKKYSCMKCGFVALDLLTLKTHVWTAHGSNSSTLNEMCNESSRETVSSFHTSNMQFTMEQAMNSFNINTSILTMSPGEGRGNSPLDLNMDASNGGKVICDLCGREFKHQQSLATHKITFHNSTPVQCEYCDFNTRNKAYMKFHQLYKHNISIPDGPQKNFHKCPSCPFMAFSRAILREHQHRHTQERPHMCQICGKRFNQKSCLLDHLRTHTGEKAFACKECPYKGRTKANLRQHVAFKHKTERPHKCPFCPYSSAVSWNLRAHVQRQHRVDTINATVTLEAKAAELANRAYPGLQHGLPTEFSSGIESLSQHKSRNLQATASQAGASNQNAM